MAHEDSDPDERSAAEGSDEASDDDALNAGLGADEEWPDDVREEGRKLFDYMKSTHIQNVDPGVHELHKWLAWVSAFLGFLGVLGYKSALLCKVLDNEIQGHQMRAAQEACNDGQAAIDQHMDGTDAVAEAGEVLVGMPSQ
eukprot:gene311-2401_t